MKFFSVKNLTAGYGKTSIINNLNFSISQGCLLGILGANGCGKTTLLKAICGIIPHTGSCVLDGTVLEKLSARQLANRCCYIPQRSGISIDISVLDVVLMGFNSRLGLLEQPSAAMKEEAGKMLALVGLNGKENVNYQTLSEGQKQLCILARTFCCNGNLLLLDEPESALDFRFRYRMLELLQYWIRAKSNADFAESAAANFTGARSAIVTLHDPSLALNYCDCLFLLSDGRILGTIFPKTDSHEKMEALLAQIYGNVSLVRCSSRSGKEHLVMLKE